MAQNHTYENLEVGDSHTLRRVITADEVRTFASLTGDDNPIHVDPEYAKDTRFGKPIVHGILLLGYISKILGHDFPGHGTIAVSISTRFLRPVPVGTEVEFKITIFDKIEERKQVKARVRAWVEDETVLGGEAIIIPPTDGKSPLERQ